MSSPSHFCIDSSFCALSALGFIGSQDYVILSAALGDDSTSHFCHIIFSVYSFILLLGNDPFSCYRHSTDSLLNEFAGPHSAELLKQLCLLVFCRAWLGSIAWA